MSDLEKTEAATPKKIRQAREEGNVPHSKELNIFIILIVSFGIMYAFNDWIISRALEILRTSIGFDPVYAHDSQKLSSFMGDLFIKAFILCIPIFVFVTIACFIPSALLKSFIFSQKALIPNFSRINPIEGIKRIFSLYSAMELLKAIIKTIMLGLIGISLLWANKEEFISLSNQNIKNGIFHSGEMIIFYLFILIGSLVFIVVLDLPFQLWHYKDKLKMTKEEIKQEMKESEGNPHIKSQIRSRQIQASRGGGRIAEAVPQADIIITNPTHYAVALSYKEGMSAPKVVAKGVENNAKTIRELAKQNKISIIEAPPLARALYKFVEIDEEIPTGLYKGVADVFSYMYKVKHWEKVGGEYPVPPDTLFINEYNV